MAKCDRGWHRTEEGVGKENVLVDVVDRAGCREFFLEAGVLVIAIDVAVVVIIVIARSVALSLHCASVLVLLAAAVALTQLRRLMMCTAREQRKAVALSARSYPLIRSTKETYTFGEHLHVADILLVDDVTVFAALGQYPVAI